jgi:hypothetical protein
MAQYIAELKDTVFSLILDLDQEELKNYDKKLLTDIITQIESILRNVISTTENTKIITNFNLALALKVFIITHITESSGIHTNPLSLSVSLSLCLSLCLSHSLCLSLSLCLCLCLPPSRLLASLVVLPIPQHVQASCRFE